jgi:hypothetical protein
LQAKFQQHSRYTRFLLRHASEDHQLSSSSFAGSQGVRRGYFLNNVDVILTLRLLWGFGGSQQCCQLLLRQHSGTISRSRKLLPAFIKVLGANDALLGSVLTTLTFGKLSIHEFQWYIHTN